jgi:hypothetical protein
LRRSLGGWLARQHCSPASGPERADGDHSEVHVENFKSGRVGVFGVDEFRHGGFFANLCHIPQEPHRRRRNGKTIEDAAELKLQKPHVVRLESRPPNAEGEGAIPIRRLVINALRMRPDRIVVGECRGGEALDMLQAMNTGHDGSLTTVHANSPRDALGRLETLVLMAGMDLPVKVVREQIRSAVHLIVQQARLSNGSRKVISITEVTGMEGETLTTQELFRFRGSGFETTGIMPKFLAARHS